MNPPPVLESWVRQVDWILDRSQHFPRRTRFTLANRLDNHALDIYELLVRARYTQDVRPALREASIRLEQLRLLARLAHRRGHLPNRAYAQLAEGLDEVGRQIGTWLRHAERGRG